MEPLNICMLLPSIIQENFLSVNEIEFISDFVYKQGSFYEDVIDGRFASNYYPWAYHKKEFAPIKEILEPKIRKLTDLNHIVDHSHILESHRPYAIHTDYHQQRLMSRLSPAYTFIIPIDDVKSHTVVFNQHSEIKQFIRYLETEKPNPVPESDRVPQEIIEQYLSHTDPNFWPYLSLKEIFTWRPGSIHACDRRYFHCSDNYKKNGLEKKRAFIFWTSVPV